MTWSRASQIGIVLARLIFAAVFAMGMAFKFLGMQETAAQISAVGLPFPMLLAWASAFFELALVLCFLTGAYFSAAATAATAYVLFLGFVFHGPAHWQANQAEFGFFVDHFSFTAGLLFAAAYGPGNRLVVKGHGRPPAFTPRTSL
jgi:putative oxidoreductase